MIDDDSVNSGPKLLEFLLQSSVPKISTWCCGPECDSIFQPVSSCLGTSAVYFMIEAWNLPLCFYTLQYTESFTQLHVLVLVLDPIPELLVMLSKPHLANMFVIVPFSTPPSTPQKLVDKVIAVVVVVVSCLIYRFWEISHNHSGIYP